MNIEKHYSLFFILLICKGIKHKPVGKRKERFPF